LYGDGYEINLDQADSRQHLPRSFHNNPKGFKNGVQPQYITQGSRDYTKETSSKRPQTVRISPLSLAKAPRIEQDFQPAERDAAFFPPQTACTRRP
jgi:hypothetical protein